jgi:hypothetical protein
LPGFAPLNSKFSSVILFVLCLSKNFDFWLGKE